MKTLKKSIKEMNKLTPSEMKEVKGGDTYIEVTIDGVTYRIKVA